MSLSEVDAQAATKAAPTTVKIAPITLATAGSLRTRIAEMIRTKSPDVVDKTVLDEMEVWARARLKRELRRSQRGAKTSAKRKWK